MSKLGKHFYIYFLSLLALLGIASLYDLEISTYLYSRANVICKSIYVLAQIPTYLIMAFFSMGIYNTRRRDGSLNSMLNAFIGVCGTSIFSFLVGYVFLYNLDLYSITIIIAVAIGIYVLCYVFTKLICDHDEENLRNTSKTALTSFVICLILGFVAITIFQRSTYRRLDNMVNIFTVWYQPSLKFDLSGFMHRSFPSMVVLVASFSLFVNFFGSFSRMARKRDHFFNIVGYAWIFAVSLSQIVLGYSYLSDVVISLLVSWIISIFVYLIVTFRKVKKAE